MERVDERVAKADALCAEREAKAIRGVQSRMLCEPFAAFSLGSGKTSCVQLAGEGPQDADTVGFRLRVDYVWKGEE